MSQRGDSYYSQAEAKLTKFSFFGSKTEKFNDAAELFKKAANSFKSLKDFSKAGKAFTRAAECFENGRSLSECADASAEAARMFAKAGEDPSLSFEAIKRAVRLYKENAKISQAARLLIELATMYQDSNNVNMAIETLREAVQMYEDESQPSQAASQLDIIADLLLKEKRYTDASREFKRVVTLRSKDNLMRTLAAKYVAKVVLCRLADDDIVGAQRDYEDLLNQTDFDERVLEARLCKNIFEAVEKGDPIAVADAATEFNQVPGRLEPWMTELLLVIKNRLEGNDDEDLT